MKKYIDKALKAYYIGKEIIINSFKVESYSPGKGFEPIIMSYCTKKSCIVWKTY